MASVNRIQRHSVGVGGALFDVAYYSWGGPDPQTEIGCQILKDGVVIGGASRFNSGGSGEELNLSASEPIDTGVGWRARGSNPIDGIKVSSAESYKTLANAATAGTPASSAVTDTTGTIDCTYTPNVVESTCSAQLQYKKVTDPSWTNAGAAQGTGGSSPVNISRNISGLTPGTAYLARLVITRTTVNATSLTSAEHYFETLQSEPTVVTNAASSVATTSANLNATVDPNTVGTCRVRFEWDTNSGEPYANQTAWQEFSGDGAQPVGASITGLSPSTTYYFRAKVQWPAPGFENEAWG